MRHPILYVLLVVSGLFSACGNSPEAEGDTPAEEAIDTSSEARNLLQEGSTLPPCPISDEMLNGNWLLVRGQNLLLVITADSTTYDADLGPSHRVLNVYNTETCQRVDRKVLPVNVSPDFPYQLAEINYNTESQLAAMKGFDVIYVYDIAARRLLPPLKARFKTARTAVDAQSGLIQRLEVWEHYLVGYAQDYGAFVFNLMDKTAPRAMLPFAEWESPEGGYHSLFLLPSGQRVQALLPKYDRQTDDFAVNPLFPEPLQIDQTGSAAAADNRYVILRLREEATPVVAVDLSRRERVALPSNLRTADNRQVEEWLKTQNR